MYIQYTLRAIPLQYLSSLAALGNLVGLLVITLAGLYIGRRSYLVF
jgi:hypothetical protein